MSRTPLLACILLLTLTALAIAQEEAPADPEASAEAVALLERVEQASDNLTSLRARLRYDRIQGLLGDEQRRFGELRYAAGPPARFAVHFEYLIVDGRRDNQNRWYIFDGRYLAEKLEDEQLFIRREIIDENQNVAEADPLRFGSGPFSLPLNLRKNEVLTRFHVETAPTSNDDPENTFLLRLTPREHLDIEQTLIELWYDNDTALPRRVRTLDSSENESIIDLLRPETSVPVRDRDYSTEPPARGYRVEEHPLPDNND
ncbi:LolA family protein [Mucisphaera sp.]|uniref:LolA family protein n=1 Tax=Mucisphaera sp. TaxID=2913024 RepID=UPI003D138498